jgi:glutamate formiminotransferase
VSGAVHQSASAGGSLAIAGFSQFAHAEQLSNVDQPSAGGEFAPLECVINVSEARSPSKIEAIALAAGTCLLDVHTDPWHNRTVLTLAGHDVEQSARSVAETTVAILDINDHAGAHPRLGVIDVVPFVPIRTGPPARVVPGVADTGPAGLAPALTARDAFAAWAAADLGVPCFLYGPERSLPEVRRRAFDSSLPDRGPAAPHPTAGAICVGARDVLVAYNLWLALDDVTIANEIAKAMRSNKVRALGLDLGGRAQVSCNLVDPWLFGPAEAFDFVAYRAPVARAELVGLVPSTVLEGIPADRWAELDLGEDRTIEARLTERGLTL